MSHTCVDLILEPSGKLIERGRTAMHWLATLAPSIIKMDVALVSTMARLGAIVTALMQFVVVVNVTWRWHEQLDAKIVMSSSCTAGGLYLIWVGFGRG